MDMACLAGAAGRTQAAEVFHRMLSRSVPDSRYRIKQAIVLPAG